MSNWFPLSSTSLSKFSGLSFFTLFLVMLGASLGLRKLYVYILMYTIGRVMKNEGEPSQKKPPSNSAMFKVKSYGTFRKTFQLSDACDFVSKGIQAIINDEVTTSFEGEQLAEWNLLSRSGDQFTDMRFQKRVYLLWFLGLLLRYCILLPFRIMFGLFGVVFFISSFSFLTLLPRGPPRKYLEDTFSFITARMFVLSWSAVIEYHDRQNKPKSGICVANHTSPIDCIVLANDNCYSMVGQRHGGFIGLLQDILSIAQKHIWFDRSEVNDRNCVLRRLREHTQDPNNNPVLIFPEGTCINNTSVMMFKKGSFETGSDVYPVAIKYNPYFSDCFWNSSKQSFLQHIFDLMTSWAVVCHVWYLPPERAFPGESAIDFASRVKLLIAEKGGLKDLQWDGQLKRQRVKSIFRQNIQKEYCSTIEFPLNQDPALTKINDSRKSYLSSSFPQPQDSLPASPPSPHDPQHDPLHDQEELQNGIMIKSKLTPFNQFHSHLKQQLQNIENHNQNQKTADPLKSIKKIQ